MKLYYSYIIFVIYFSLFSVKLTKFKNHEVQQCFTSVPVPNLFGMKFIKVKEFLEKKNLKLGSTIYTLEGGSQNLEDQIVYLQNPKEKNEKGIQNYIKKGDTIDIWILGINSVVDTSIRIKLLNKK